MPISVGEMLPEGTLMEVGPDGPTSVSVADVLGGGKAVVLGMPGAFTGTCTSEHLPSFQKNMDDLKAKGVDTVVCVTVNDPFVVKAWGDATGAPADGIRLMADPEGAFVGALGLTFDAPPVGLINRALRFAILADGGKVSRLHVEDSPGDVSTSSAEALLAAM